MSRPDLVRDTAKALRLLKRVATGELTAWDLLSGLGKGDDHVIRAEEGIDEQCDQAPGCTAPKGHEGGCVLDAAVEPEESASDDAQATG